MHLKAHATIRETKIRCYFNGYRLACVMLGKVADKKDVRLLGAIRCSQFSFLDIGMLYFMLNIPRIILGWFQIIRRFVLYTLFGSFSSLPPHRWALCRLSKSRIPCWQRCWPGCYVGREAD
jgi:hypothetical protein